MQRSSSASSHAAAPTETVQSIERAALPRKRKQDNGNPACLEAAASKTRKKAVQHDEVSSRMIAKNLI